MPLTVGTAGHIDHGKTWLVRALTGKDTDRLPEEQERGISIDLGYAPLELADGRRLSLVDVPGHERFVRNMVAGATGIDLFLLVVDAGEGARPQTHEHLAIIRLLGIEHGVVALTKVDAVDAETRELALEEARELVPGAAVVATSARTGEGLDELRAALAEAADRVEQRPAERPTRLFVDRVFTLQGIGTVVTGTLWSGSVGEGDELRAEPAGLDVRVRSVQVHDRPVERAEAGQRVAVALPGVERRDLRRGDALVEPGAYPVGYRLDIALEPLVEIADGTRLHVHHGTAEHLRTSRPRRRPSRAAAPRLARRSPRVATGSCSASGRRSAAGIVLDPAPPRRTSEERLDLLERGDPVSIVWPRSPPRASRSAATSWRAAPCSRARSSTKGSARPSARATGTSPPSGSRSCATTSCARSTSARRLPARSRHPGGGAPAAAAVGGGAPPLLPIERRGAQGLRARGDRGPRRPGGGGRAARGRARGGGLHAGEGRGRASWRATSRRRAASSALGDGLAVGAAAYEEARRLLVEECTAAGSITLARFRDLLGTGRKPAQLLLERFDADGITRRVGDERVLRRKAQTG